MLVDLYSQHKVKQMHSVIRALAIPIPACPLHIKGHLSMQGIWLTLAPFELTENFAQLTSSPDPDPDPDPDADPNSRSSSKL